MNKDDLAAKLTKATLDDMSRPMSNKDDVAGLVERLQKHIFYGDARLFNMQQHSPLAMEAADALTTLFAENERLIEANRLRMEETHKERAEAKLWFEKAQEWRDENTTLSARVETMEAANARLREAQAMHGGRYWEARYRDEAADNAKLREIISRASDAYWGMRQTELSASEVGVELADKIANTGYGLHLKIAMKDAQALAGDDHG